MNRPELCSKCGGLCCKDTYFTMKEYSRLSESLPGQALGPDRMRPEGNGYISIGNCPASTPRGCIWEYENRPFLCRVYPFIPIIGKQGGFLLLAIRTCPRWKEFGELYWDQVKEIEDMGVKIV